MDAEPSKPSGATRPCPRCKDNEAIHELRSEHVCGACFAAFVRIKAAKRFEVVDRESRGKVGRGTAHYLIGLSLSQSSSAMVHIFDELDERSAKKRRPVSSSFRVIHVDTAILEPDSSGPHERLARWSAAYPRFNFEVVPLTVALALDTIDWAALPRLRPDLPPEGQLRDLFCRLPSSTSRADVARLFVRRILMSLAATEPCCALLLGSNTTSLAALTLAEAAKGRGLSLPWLVGDGAHPVGDSPGSQGSEPASIVVHFPLRELYLKELIAYSRLVGMDKDLALDAGARSSGSIVSRKDQSIDDVMTRYFEDVEQSYPSVVANVVRTAGKLSRTETSSSGCGLCGALVDTRGTEAREAQSGDEEGAGCPSPPSRAPADRRLCYGCRRSVNG